MNTVGIRIVQRNIYFCFGLLFSFVLFVQPAHALVSVDQTVIPQNAELTAGMWGSIKDYTKKAGDALGSAFRSAAEYLKELRDGPDLTPQMSIEVISSDKARISWSFKKAKFDDPPDKCEASGDWGGDKSTSGNSEEVGITCGRHYEFKLECVNFQGNMFLVPSYVTDPGSGTSHGVMPDDKKFRSSVGLDTGQCAPGESTVTESQIYQPGSGGSSGGGSKPSYCSTIDRGSGACAKACYTSVKKCDGCKYKNGCGGSAPEEKENIEVELKGPDPSQKRSDGLRRVKADKEVEYKAEVDHNDDDEKIEYRFKCNEDKTGRQQKVDSKKDSQKFRCTYTIKKGTEKYQDPVIRVEQKDRGKAKDTKTILVYLDPFTSDPSVDGGGDTPPPAPSAAPETDIRGE